jgi:hypothetical protein
MSDVGRKMDVEDVLSSIRRLVSEEARSAQPPVKPTAERVFSPNEMLHERNEYGPEKLVLTPSLRVKTAHAPTPVTADIEQRIADIESLVMSEAIAAERAEISKAVELQDADEEFDNARDDITATADDVEKPLQSQDSTDQMMAALHLSMKDFVRAEPPLTANLASAPRSEPPAPQISVDENPTALERQQTPVAEFIEDAEFVEVAEESFLNFPTDSPFEEDAGDAEDHSDLAAALEAIQDPVRDTAPMIDLSSEPSIPQDYDYGLDDEEIEEPIPTIVARQPEMPTLQPQNPPDPTSLADTDPDDFEEPVDYTDGSDAFLDEESLREMVSEMVRSELQGELGDRITRNVRKLVRREIYRALASREFE